MFLVANPGRPVGPQRAAAASSACASSAPAATACASCSIAPRSRSHDRMPKRIEAALGHPVHHTFPSDYKTVSTALNSGVPLAQAGNSDLAAQFDLVHPAASCSWVSAAWSWRRWPRPAPISFLGGPDSASRNWHTHLVTATMSTTAYRRRQSASTRCHLSLSAADFTAHHSRRAPGYVELKGNVHRKLLNRLNLEALAPRDRSRAEGEIRDATSVEILSRGEYPAQPGDRDVLLGELIDEVFGLGPLEPLLRDATVSDILVNTHKHVFVERNGMLERVPTSFQDDKHLLRVIDRIVSGVGRRIDDARRWSTRASPTARASTRSPAAGPGRPAAVASPVSGRTVKADELVALGALTPPMPTCSTGACSRLNASSAEGPGGKTTLLVLVRSSRAERIVTVEDAAELQLHRARRTPGDAAPNWKATARSPAELVLNALRMRPDRIVVGEVRGGEALDMLQAMNTGHDGSLTTVHANSPATRSRRIETMIAMGATTCRSGRCGSRSRRPSRSSSSRPA